MQEQDKLIKELMIELSSENLEYAEKMIEPFINDIKNFDSLVKSYSSNTFTINTKVQKELDKINAINNNIFNYTIKEFEDFDSYLTGTLTEKNTIFNFGSVNTGNSLGKSGKFDEFLWENLRNRKFFTKILIDKSMGKNFYQGFVNISNKKFGFGVLYLPNGVKIQGSFNNDTLEGFGRVIDEKGTVSEGHFSKGVLEGKGMQILLNGQIFIGNFIGGVREGKGYEENDEIMYEGMYKGDKKEGKGSITFKKIDENYEGEFHDDKIDGFGKYKWKNGNEYIGFFSKGKMDGKGRFTWGDGSEYFGTYVNGIKEGYGQFTWNNGKTYNGPFENGKMQGEGILEFNGDKYKVIFEDGKLVKQMEIYKSNENNLVTISDDKSALININNNNVSTISYFSK